MTFVNARAIVSRRQRVGEDVSLVLETPSGTVHMLERSNPLDKIATVVP